MANKTKILLSSWKVIFVEYTEAVVKKLKKVFLEIS